MDASANKSSLTRSGSAETFGDPQLERLLDFLWRHFQSQANSAALFGPCRKCWCFRDLRLMPNDM
jgi:hypothetical protein